MTSSTSITNGNEVGRPTGREEAKREWLAALRSGEFTQNRGGWQDAFSSMSFCCLGVAGQVFGLPWADYDGMRAKLGMSEETKDRLIQMNDKQKLSFTEIADWVEATDLETGEPLPSAPVGAP